MSDNTPQREPSPYMALALLGQIGLSVAVPVVVAVLFGNWLDKRLGMHGIVLMITILAGIGAGVYDAWRLISKVLGTNSWKK